MLPNYPSSQLSLGHYILFSNNRLGSGAFGDVYRGQNIINNQKIAIKCENKNTRHPQLQYETGVLQYLQGGKGIPIFYEFIPSQKYNFMIFELLGPSLESLFDSCSRKFSLKTILLLGEQMLSRVKFLHLRHLIHRDIKPDNFLMGINDKKKIVYIIDFGLAKRFRNKKTGLHLPYKDGKSLTGTVRYASIYTHLGIEQSRRDDLESLAYSLIYFSNGFLPWQGLRVKNKEEKYNRILEKKINTKVEDICKDLPKEFITFLQYVRSLQYEEKPDYDYLKKLIEIMGEKNGVIWDFGFDFNDKVEKWEKAQNEVIVKKKYYGNVIEDKDMNNDVDDDKNDNNKNDINKNDINKNDINKNDNNKNDNNKNDNNKSDNNENKNNKNDNNEIKNNNNNDNLIIKDDKKEEDKVNKEDNLENKKELNDGNFDNEKVNINDNHLKEINNIEVNK